MSDKNEYWRELFGEDFPDYLDSKTEPPKQEPEPDMELDWFSFDSDYYKQQPEPDKEDLDSFSDTSVLPNDITDIKHFTESMKPPEAPPAAPVQQNYVLEDVDHLDDDDKAIRREPRKRSGCLGGIMYFVFIVGVSVILTCAGWLAATDVLALNKEYLEAEITVSDDFTISDVAGDLKNAGLIEYKFLFKIFANIYHADEKIESGTYVLNTDYDYRALISQMGKSSKSQVSVTVTIQEGKTLEETFALLEEEGVCSAENLMDAAANYEFEYDFLSSNTLGDASRLEGFLFPDTYDFYKNTAASSVIDKLLKNFNSKMEDNRVYEAVEASDYSLYEILTIASMLEKEAASGDEMPIVASVIYNRLGDGMKLQIDATIQYILEERRENLTSADLEIDSLYNTYMYDGLPPTPIANPGITAILAALNPESTSYYYYALHVDGYHKFFKYGDSHQDFV